MGIDFDRIRFQGEPRNTQAVICGKCPNRFLPERPETCDPVAMRNATRTGVCSRQETFRPLRITDYIRINTHRDH